MGLGGHHEPTRKVDYLPCFSPAPLHMGSSSFPAWKILLPRASPFRRPLQHRPRIGLGENTPRTAQSTSRAPVWPPPPQGGLSIYPHLGCHTGFPRSCGQCLRSSYRRSKPCRTHGAPSSRELHRHHESVFKNRLRLSRRIRCLPRRVQRRVHTRCLRRSDWRPSACRPCLPCRSGSCRTPR